MKINGFLKKLFLLATLLISGTAFAQVATLVELKGTAQAIPAVGVPRDLRQGDSINQGETVATKAMTTAVIRFEDGQIVALTQNSRFAITNYTYNKMEPAKSSILLSLLDGGMRAVTGLIGKAKPENVTYKAANATIGIRGTDVTVGTLGGNLTISVVQGSISFVFQGKTTSVSAGEGVDARTDGTVRKAALADFYANLSPEMKAVFTDADKIILDRLIRQAGQQDIRDNPVVDGTKKSSGSQGSSTGSGGGRNCTRVNGVLPSGC